jgi:hypothetical protein
MSGLNHITAEIVISHNRAADRSNADGSALNAEFVDCLGNEAVNYTVGAAGAVMERRIGQ